jgi:hypothetical protein
LSFHGTCVQSIGTQFLVCGAPCNCSAIMQFKTPAAADRWRQWDG